MSRVVPLGLVMLFCVVLGFPADHSAEPEASLEERVRVRSVRIPILLDEKSPGGCDAVQADWIEIVEDGRGVRASHLEPRRLRTSHAILIDTSRSMVDDLQFRHTLKH